MEKEYTNVYSQVLNKSALPKAFVGKWPNKLFECRTSFYFRVSSPASLKENLNQGGKSTENMRNGFETDVVDLSQMLQMYRSHLDHSIAI